MSTPCTNCNCPAGPRGNAGIDGAPGATGAQGIQGLPGTNGTNGTNGVGIASVVQDSVNTIHFVKTDATTTGTITLPAGPTGATGAQGPPGTNGTNGTSVTITSPNGTLTVGGTTSAPTLDINFADADVTEGIQDVAGPFIAATGLFTYNDAANGLVLPVGATPGQVAMVNNASNGIIYAKPVDKSGFKNYITNGDFTLSQRGPGPFTTTGHNIDRWLTGLGASDVASVSLVAMTPAERNSLPGGDRRSFRRTVFTGSNASLAQVEHEQKIENPQALVGRQVTVSAWIKSNNNTPVSFAAYLYPGVGAVSVANTVNLTGQVAFATTGVWTRYSLTFTVPNAGTWGSDNEPFLSIRLALSSGSTYNTQFGNVGAQSGTVDDWGWQLEVGDTATELEYVPIADTVARCQRFFYRTGLTGHGFAYSSTNSYFGPIIFGNSMRVGPIVTVFAPVVLNQIGIGNTPVTIAGTNVSYNAANIDFAGSFTPSTHLAITSGVLDFSAEL